MIFLVKGTLDHHREPPLICSVLSMCCLLTYSVSLYIINIYIIYIHTHVPIQCTNHDMSSHGIDALI